jgi:hypothetical protein
MKAKYGIPQSVIDEIEARDLDCVYCRKPMIREGSPLRKGGWSRRAEWASIEHLNHLPTAVHAYPMTAEYFAVACTGCNASRRDKPLTVFLALKGYADTCAQVVKNYARRPQASWPMTGPA